MNDPLAKFRRGAVSPSIPVVVAPGEKPVSRRSGNYIAFQSKEQAKRLRFRSAARATRSPSYSYLLDVIYDGDFGTEIVLLYTFLSVILKGRNLQELAAGLEEGTIDYVQEFDPERWELPVDQSVAVIESIEVVVKNGAVAPGQGKAGSSEV